MHSDIKAKATRAATNMSAPTTQTAPTAQNGQPRGAAPAPRAPGASPALNARSPLLTSSPYLRSMALLDNMDLQQLMAGGDLNQEEAARRAQGLANGGPQRSPEDALGALAAITARTGHTPPGQYDSLAPPAEDTNTMRRVTSHDQLTATAAAVAALSSPRERSRSPLVERPPPAPAEDSGPGADARRRDVRRERNREHARISRERKRQKLEHLQEENDALRKEQVLVDERNSLRMRLDEQERQNAGLRAYIQRHRHLLGDVAAAVLARRRRPRGVSGGWRRPQPRRRELSVTTGRAPPPRAPRSHNTPTSAGAPRRPGHRGDGRARAPLAVHKSTMSLKEGQARPRTAGSASRARGSRRVGVPRPRPRPRKAESPRRHSNPSGRPLI